MSVRLPSSSVLVGLLTLGGGPSVATAQPADGDPPQAAIPQLAEALVEGADTAYVSDYISFAGSDSMGFVAFALDNNRGRAGADYQAEHFVALFDERRGWIDVEGYDSFANDEGVLLGYPESPYFEFVGEPYALESIRSKSAPLNLSIGELEERITERDDTTVFSLASGPAALVWDGRRIEGRVIYEYLAIRGANRLAGMSVRGVWDMLVGGPDFQGLYLASENGEDLYVHLARSSAASGLAESPLMAFSTRDNLTQPIENLVFDVADFDAALGFYRWPAAWRLRWETDCGRATLTVDSLAHDTQTNWVLGGFAMRGVRGLVSCGGETKEIYGLAELIR